MLSEDNGGIRMSNVKPKIFIDHESKTFNLSRVGPLPGTEGGEDFADVVLRGLVTDITEHFNGIAELIDGVLELDSESYSYYLSGTPVSIARLGGGYLGYSVHLSIYPTVVKGEPKTVRLVDKLPRAKH